MKKINWYLKAAQDLKSIYTFYSFENQRTAFSIYKQIRISAQRLKQFPYLGPVEALLADKPEEYRSLPVKKYYKIIYYIENNTINIVAVWDCRRNPETLKQSIE